MSERPLRVLWLARANPWPLVMGDRVYSARLVQSLGAAGAEVHFLGFPSEEAGPPPPSPGVTWTLLDGKPRSRIASLFSLRPLVARQHDTEGYRAAILARAAEPWDAVVLDQYGMGWVLDLRERFTRDGYRPPFVFIAHDHEESLLAQIARETRGNPAKRAVLWQNAAKTRWSERATARGVDLVTTITEHDSGLFRANQPDLRTLVLTPGYDGARRAERRIDETTPPGVLLFGSYTWIAKQENLRRFLASCHDALAAAGLGIEVVGRIPDALRDELRPRFGSARFHGFVDDPAPFFDRARVAVVAEPIGGGFKMKLPELFLNRVPVAALESCLSGLPTSLHAAMVVYPDLGAMAVGLPAAVRDHALLDGLQDAAYRIALPMFDWSARGAALRSAIAELVAARRAAAPARPEAGARLQDA